MNKLKILESLCDKYSSCTRCTDISTNRTSVVFGAGNINADIMVIGEAPGEAEDMMRQPVAGRAWEMLQNAMLEAGIDTNNVYYTNTVLCRPVSIEQGKKGPYKKDRDPLRTELDACKERLHQEIYTVDPKVVLLLGPKAAGLVTHLTMQNIVGSYQRIKIPGKTEKTVLSYPAIATYHPNQVLRVSSRREPGSIATQFHEHINLLGDIVRVAESYYTKHAQ